MHLPPPLPSLQLLSRIIHLLALLKSVKCLRCALIMQLSLSSPVLTVSLHFILPAVFPVFSSSNPNNSTITASVVRQPCAIHMLLESYHSLNCPLHGTPAEALNYNQSTWDWLCAWVVFLLCTIGQTVLCHFGLVFAKNPLMYTSRCFAHAVSVVHI